MMMNSLMIPIWERRVTVIDSSLPDGNEYLLERGWVVGPGGSLLLRGLFGPGWKRDWAHDEVAQHEYEVNDVRISSAAAPADRDSFLAEMLSRALRFTSRALAGASSIEAADALVAVISIGVAGDYVLHGTTVKFFTLRGDYPDYFVDLERFELEAMAVIEPGDLPVPAE
jgi:hypothetical protein